MSERISVTEVRNALRCPRIFALGRLYQQAVAFPVGSSCLGAAFHRIVELFSRDVEHPPAHFASLQPGTPRDETEAHLAQWLLDYLFRELEADVAYATMPGEVDDLAEALREFARHLAGRLQGFAVRPGAALPQVVRTGERAVEARVQEDGPVVHGRLDALYSDARGNLEVVEYKLTDEANDEMDRAQVALYRSLLRASDGGDATPVILRFTPTLRETALTAESADALVDRVVQPLLDQMASWLATPESAPPTHRKDLCSACPVARECAETYPERLAVRDDPPAAATRPRPARAAEAAIQDAAPLPSIGPGASDEEGRREAEQLRDRILAELKKQGTAVVCPRPPVVGPTLFLIEVARPRGPVSQLDRAAEDVRHRLAAEADIDLSYEKQGGHRRFIVRRAKPRRVLLGPLLEQKRDWLLQRPGRFIVGQQPDGEVLCADLSDSGTPHLLVAGQSGSGKSVLLQAIVAGLLQYHAPESIRFVLVDPKRVTFNGPSFRSAVSAHLEGPIRAELEDTLPVIQQLVEVMEERYRLFESAQVMDIEEYNEQASQAERLNRRVLVIDEFQDLFTDKAAAQTFFAGVKRLGAKARAAGVHLILATQRPDRDTVPPVIKSNLGGKIALQVASQPNSRIILDQNGAERLLGKGDLLASLGKGIVRAQAPLLAER
ncbi:MAG TPA: FtsK/SpoIIIE domain-containing protein [Polyangiaceae bacterium]|nr:FtsK/SpoIIIE domain-containing protein [Polyangiaceae bacterium]